MMTYEEHSKQAASEKIVLCIAEAVDQFKVWQTTDDVNVFKRDVLHFVTKVKEGITSLVSGALPLAPGQFYFDAKAMKLYVRTTDDAHPKTKSISATYKFFYSNHPVILPHDLSTGEEVEFEGRIPDGGIGSLGQQLDDENTGIVLESSSNVGFLNSDGYFDEIFDALLWENQSIDFYSWSPTIPLSEAQHLFSGVIESKTFDDEKVSFKVKDFVYRLKNKVDLGLFSDADGSLSDSDLNTPKRRIYGQVKQATTVGLDKILKGYVPTGTVSVATGSDQLTGTGTSFLDELSPEDEIFLVLDDGTEVKLSIDSIEGNTAATLGDESEFNITNKTIVVKPKIPWRKKNRRWHIAGHKLRAPVATITFPTTSRRFAVDSVEDFFSDDLVTLNSSPLKLKRISGNNMVMSSSIFPLPAIGDTIEKSPVSKVFFGSKEMLPERDWDLQNTTEAIVEFNDLAEFNIANARTFSFLFTFTNGSRTVSTTSPVDLKTLLRPRDWIRKNSITETDWYEVLEVNAQTVILRTVFTGTTQTTEAKYKNIEPINDESLITVNCLGMEYEGKWIKTASDAVRHLILNDSKFDSVDEDSFAQAKADCEYILSMITPESIGQEAPQVRDVITKINESVFGSLYGNKSMAIAYSILNARKPSDGVPIREDDILSWESTTEQKIVNRVKINYSPFVDLYTGESAFSSIEFSSEFVDQLIGIQNTEDKTVYLFEDWAAEIIAQRVALFRSLSNCKITLKTKLNLSTSVVNDKVYIDHPRLFKRYGGKDSKKISIITGIKKNGVDTEVELTDLGNIFNRVGSIAEDSIGSYDTAPREHSLRYAFIVDNDTLTPDVDSEIDLGNNRIG